MINSFNNSYNNLSSDSLFFFWIIIFLFIFLVVISIILINKNKKLVKILKEEQEKVEDNKEINNNILKQQQLEVPVETKEVPLEESASNKEEEKIPVVKEEIKEEVKEEVKENNLYQKNVLREISSKQPVSPIHIEKKEEYIDSLFEESYQQKRLYPYLSEEFSVMAMDISEKLLMIRIDMPNRDLGEASCYRIYLAWNSVDRKGRFFTIEKGASGSVLGEITSDWKHANYGAAPVEGAEISRLLELMENEKTHTS